MSVAQREPTKDGRRWVFRVRYKTLSGNTKYYTSCKYKTKREALDEEKHFLANRGKLKLYDMTFKDLYNNYYNFQSTCSTRKKDNTLRSYIERYKHLKSLDSVKIVEFDLDCYNMWRKEMLNCNLSDATRNNVQKLLKSLLNFATKKYKFNFSDVYDEFESFKDPNIPCNKEMLFYTYDEFKQFIAVEDDLCFKVAFEILYYCGLRSGELRGLCWNNIDFERKELRVVNNVVKDYFGEKSYKVTSPKTDSSTRTLPLPNFLISDLELLKKENESYYGFKDNWFVLGTIDPISSDRLRLRKNRNSELSGVKQIRIHDFRHSCASLLISKGANITLVARYLGHSKIEETLRTYAHFYRSDLVDLATKMDNLGFE